MLDVFWNFHKCFLRTKIRSIVEFKRLWVLKSNPLEVEKHKITKYFLIFGAFNFSDGNFQEESRIFHEIISSEKHLNLAKIVPPPLVISDVLSVVVVVVVVVVV